MVRKMAVIGLSYLTGLFIAPFFTYRADILIGICLFGLGIFLAVYLRKTRKLAIGIGICTVAIGFCVYGIYDVCVYEKICLLDGQTLSVNARVIDKFAEDNTTESYLLKGKVEGYNVKFYIYSDARLNYEDNIKAEVKFSEIKNTQYFPSKDYYKSKEVFLKAELETIYSVTSDKNILYYIKTYSDYVANKITMIAPNDSGAMINSMFTGDRTHMPSELMTALYNTGIGHITAISGFHLTVVASVAMFLSKKFRLKQRFSIFVMLFICLSYCVFSGLSISTLRATVMVIIFYTAQLASRRADSLNSIGLAAFVLVLDSPVSAHDASLLLSLLGTLGIAVVGPSLNKYIDSRKENKGKLRGLRVTFISSVCASLCTAPIAILYFNGISLISPVIILIATPFCTVALISTLIYAVFGCMPGFIISGADFLLDFLLKFVKFISDLDLFYLNINGTEVYIWLATVSIGFVLCAFIFKSHKKNIIFLMSAFMLVLCVNMAVKFKNSDKYYITVLSDNYKGAVVVEKSGSADIIVLSHSTYIISCIDNYLNQANIDKISTLICYEMDQSDLSVFKYLEKYDIDSIIVSENIIDDINYYKIFDKIKIISFTDMEITRPNCYNIYISNNHAVIKSDNFNMLCAYSKDFENYSSDNYSLAVYSGITKNEINAENIGLVSVVNENQAICRGNYINIYRTPIFSFGIDKNGEIIKRSNAYAIYN